MQRNNRGKIAVSVGMWGCVVAKVTIDGRSVQERRARGGREGIIKIEITEKMVDWKGESRREILSTSSLISDGTCV